MPPKQINKKKNKKQKNKNQKAAGKQPANKITAQQKYTPTPKVKGKGDYSAESIGGGIGSYLGSMAGRLFKSVTGLGDYSVSASRLNMGNSPPLFDSKRAPIIEHREFLSNIRGSVGFAATHYSINPGLNATFPWLWNLANNFEEYRLLGMLFEFKSTSANSLASTNTALGTVIMATEYDVGDVPFNSKSQMENHQFSCSAPPSLSQLHPVECAPSLTTLPQRYIRSSAVPPGDDPKFYDWGRFTIATSGMQAVADVGELWVTYRIQLLKPQMGNPNEDNLFYHAQTLGSSQHTQLYQLQPRASNTLGMYTEPNTAQNNLYFPNSVTSGSFVILISVNCTANTALAKNVPTLINCTSLNIFNFPTAPIPSNNTNWGMFAPDNGSSVSNTHFMAFGISVSGQGAGINFDNVTNATVGLCNWDLYIIGIDPNTGLVFPPYTGRSVANRQFQVMEEKENAMMQKIKDLENRLSGLQHNKIINNFMINEKENKDEVISLPNTPDWTPSYPQGVRLIGEPKGFGDVRQQGIMYPDGSKSYVHFNVNNKKVEVVPAPRLVGIETNPGPTFVIGRQHVMAWCYLARVAMEADEVKTQSTRQNLLGEFLCADGNYDEKADADIEISINLMVALIGTGEVSTGDWDDTQGNFYAKLVDQIRDTVQAQRPGHIELNYIFVTEYGASKVQEVSALIKADNEAAIVLPEVKT